MANVTASRGGSRYPQLPNLFVPIRFLRFLTSKRFQNRVLHAADGKDPALLGISSTSRPPDSTQQRKMESTCVYVTTKPLQVEITNTQSCASNPDRRCTGTSPQKAASKAAKEMLCSHRPIPDREKGRAQTGGPFLRNAQSVDASLSSFHICKSVNSTIVPRFLDKKFNVAQSATDGRIPCLANKHKRNSKMADTADGRRAVALWSKAHLLFPGARPFGQQFGFGSLPFPR